MWSEQLATHITMVVLRQMSDGPDALVADPRQGLSLDEREHQVLDTLDSLLLGSLWTSLEVGQDGISSAPPTAFAVAVSEAGEDLAEVEAAIEAARPLLVRLIAIMADRLLLAAETLADTDDRGALELGAIARARQTLNESPERAPVLASAVEAVGVSLGLDRQGIAWAILVSLGERASTDADPDLRACSSAIAERLTAAQPSSDATPSRELRLFRSAAVSAAGPEIRARLLAAGRLEHLALARALVEAHEDPATLVDHFDAAVAALAEAKSEQVEDSAPELLTDGPKRKFTVVHLILALIILALTVWHYGFR